MICLADHLSCCLWLVAVYHFLYVLAMGSEGTANIAAMPTRRAQDTPSASRLAELAEQEAAQLRELQQSRLSAVRQFDTARAAILHAEKSLAIARQDQAMAVATLLGSGLDVSTVAHLLEIDPRRVRELRGPKREGRPSGEGMPAPTNE